MLTYKRKLKLTKAQEQRIVSWIGVCRMVYNMGLEIKTIAWKNKEQNISRYDLNKQITQIRETEWVRDVPAQSLQGVMDRLDDAYKRFYKWHGFPKFKSKKEYRSILFKNGNKGTDIKTQLHNIKLPKIGQIKMFKNKQEIIGNIKTATIVKEPTGWFICIVTDAVKNISNKDENQVIGLDMGIAHFCTDSNGNHIANPQHFKKYEDKLRIENRSLSRKKKGSNRWKKQAQRLAKIHHTIGNVRKDFLHKQSTIIAKNYHTVYLEDLNIKGMVKSNLAKSISDCGWGAFRIMLNYKTNVVAVNPKYTSQTCNECGVKDSKSRISQAEFACTNCGHISNADVNASKNILSWGTAINRKSKSLDYALVEESNLDMSTYCYKFWKQNKVGGNCYKKLKLIKTTNMENCSITGLPKTVHIEYFLNGESLGKTMVSEGSMSQSRIAEAKAIGIEKYDGFVLDNGRADSRTVIIDGKPLDDFNPPKN